MVNFHLYYSNKKMVGGGGGGGMSKCQIDMWLHSNCTYFSNFAPRVDRGSETQLQEIRSVKNVTP